MISLMPEETAELLFTGSSPPARLWFCRVQQPSATPGESSARLCQSGQGQPLRVVPVGRQTGFCSKIMFRAYFSGLIFKHCKNICVSKCTFVKFATTSLSTWAIAGGDIQRDAEGLSSRAGLWLHHASVAQRLPFSSFLEQLPPSPCSLYFNIHFAHLRGTEGQYAAPAGPDRRAEDAVFQVGV